MIDRQTAIRMAAALWFALVATAGASAQGVKPPARPAISFDRLGYIEPGTYLAGDTVQFTLAAEGDHYLLCMGDSPEVFVLRVDHASLGGRVLKYDTGETALKVAGWGGMTLYTDAAPEGLPATRTGDAPVPKTPSISLQDMQTAAGDDDERLAYTRHIAVRFIADWNALANDAATRAFAFDAMENVARGIDQFTSSRRNCDALARRVTTVSVKESASPALGLNARVLVVTFDPGQGFSGRVSSRAVARALGSLLIR